MIFVVIALVLLSLSWVADCLERVRPWGGPAAERQPAKHGIFSRIETGSHTTLGLLTFPGVTGVTTYWRVRTSSKKIEYVEVGWEVTRRIWLKDDREMQTLDPRDARASLGTDGVTRWNA